MFYIARVMSSVVQPHCDALLTPEDTKLTFSLLYVPRNTRLVTLLKLSMFAEKLPKKGFSHVWENKATTHSWYYHFHTCK